MKIGRYTYSHTRRTATPAVVPSPVEPPKPKRKALLIGICYDSGAASTSQGYAALKGPHADVAAMKKLLVSQYGYAEGDVVELMDDEEGSVRPTRVNILRAIDDLVRGARKGDRFFFHYCGHTMQVENRNNSEEDGMDECLVPLDGEENKIVDNELRRHLVEALPPGSSLVAVFDSCHSASLLDLAHFRCNRVYVPWLSKGRRRSDERWNSVVRRHALPFSLSKPPTPAHSPTRSRSRANSSARSPPLSRANTSLRSPLRSAPFAPLQANSPTTVDKLLRKTGATPERKATRRSMREIRELMQLLDGVPVASFPRANAVDPHFVPTRPNSPLATSPERGEHAPPMVTTRRIYEAARSRAGKLRAWRTEVDRLEVDDNEEAVHETGNTEYPDDDEQQTEPIARAGTEEPDEAKSRVLRKRLSLPLGSLSLASFGVGVRKGNEDEEGDVKVEGKGKTKGRHTTVTRARAVSVAVQHGEAPGSRGANANTSPVAAAGAASSAAGKENVVVGVAEATRPPLAVAVPSAKPVSWFGDEDHEGRECESPAPVWPCTGWTCRDPAHRHEYEEDDQAEVISLASCKDHQVSWEDSNGGSMTRELVRILEREPHPTIRTLVTHISHAMHRMSLERHLETRRYKQDMKKYEAFLERQRANAALLRPGSSGSTRGAETGENGDTKAPATETSTSRATTLSLDTPGPDSGRSSRMVDKSPKQDTDGMAVRHPKQPKAKAKSEGFIDESQAFDMNNFQDPQVASHYPLDMEQTWKM
ncbi:mitochondrial chaperone BCS1 [Favolaschia claudopus]|uniref:Mitochondrial chaperone BCS1 n=1 Tax=Favolaschia claudopus TaxID=2862362 RepID=A0AAW0DWN3_9AGAR